MTTPQDGKESRVAVLVDCDNVPTGNLDHALCFVARFGRVVVRRGYGNPAALASARWQDALVQQAFTPNLQYQYASGKKTADIALALDALEMLFDDKGVFCRPNDVTNPESASCGDSVHSGQFRHGVHHAPTLIEMKKRLALDAWNRRLRWHP